MKCLGIDPSSTTCGAALVDDFELLDTWAWDKTKRRSPSWNLNDYYEWLLALIDGLGDTHMACVEFLSVTRNAQTVRKVSHFQAASVLACKQRRLLVVEARVSSARAVALGNGGMSKEAAFDEIKKRYPDHGFRRRDRGGMDETDAVVLALSGPGIAESR